MHILESRILKQNMKSSVYFSQPASALDICLFVSYCLFVFAILPVLVIPAWGFESLSVNWERTQRKRAD